MDSDGQIQKTEHVIAPCLWFDTQAEEAARFYVEAFPDSRIKGVSHYPTTFDTPGDKPRGSLLTVEFEIAGTAFTALNGGPGFRINPSISFFLNFDPSRDPKARERLDATWQRLLEGGTPLMPLDKYPFSERYGWVQDRFGVSWQLILSDPEGEPRPFIVPSLLFVGEMAGRAEEAMRFYQEVFEDSKQGIVARYGPDQPPDKEGAIMFADFMIRGQWFAAMDSAQEHDFGFSEGVSLQVMCRDQDEVDRYWKRLSEGGEPGVCGWLKDRFGVSWQIVPVRFMQIIEEGEAGEEGYERAFKAMLEMKKLDIGKLEQAYEGR
jgi:predicted 3-demethylubiquinone-9 3-methyltransferase (glyoxalase superfamily)